jgi:hypothetical protein
MTEPCSNSVGELREDIAAYEEQHIEDNSIFSGNWSKNRRKRHIAGIRRGAWLEDDEYKAASDLYGINVCMYEKAY